MTSKCIEWLKKDNSPSPKIVVDLTQIKKLASERFDIIFHLAAIVSGEAEENFEKGWDVNLFSMWQLLEALKTEHFKSWL
mgnify:CR=1 FL=1